MRLLHMRGEPFRSASLRAVYCSTLIPNALLAQYSLRCVVGHLRILIRELDTLRASAAVVLLSNVLLLQNI